MHIQYGKIERNRTSFFGDTFQLILSYLGNFPCINTYTHHYMQHIYRNSNMTIMTTCLLSQNICVKSVKFNVSK